MAKQTRKLQPSLWDAPPETAKEPAVKDEARGVVVSINDWTLDVDEPVGIVGIEFDSCLGSTLVEVTPGSETTHYGVNADERCDFQCVLAITVIPKDGSAAYFRRVFIEPSSCDVYLGRKNVIGEEVGQL